MQRRENSPEEAAMCIISCIDNSTHLFTKTTPEVVVLPMIITLARMTTVKAMKLWSLSTDDASQVCEEDLLTSNYVIERAIQNEFKKLWGNLLNHIKSDPSPPLGQPLEDVFARVLRMRILSSHLKERSPGQTTLMDLLAIDMSAVKYTIGGAQYNAAKISDTGETVEQDGVAQKNTRSFLRITFCFTAPRYTGAVLQETSIRKTQYLFNPSFIFAIGVAKCRVPPPAAQPDLFW
jgi:hypothetical protein